MTRHLPALALLVALWGCGGPPTGQPLLAVPVSNVSQDRVRGNLRGPGDAGSAPVLWAFDLEPGCLADTVLERPRTAWFGLLWIPRDHDAEILLTRTHDVDLGGVTELELVLDGAGHHVELDAAKRAGSPQTCRPRQ